MQQWRYPWDTEPAPVTLPKAPEPPPRGKPRGRRPASARRAMVRVAVTAPGWLYHHLTISGPAKSVADFAAAACGSGVTPWQLDGADIAEDIFILPTRSASRSRGRAQRARLHRRGQAPSWLPRLRLRNSTQKSKSEGCWQSRDHPLLDSQTRCSCPFRRRSIQCRSMA